MIIEHVHLNIKADQHQAFKQAFESAKMIIYPMQGLNAVQLIQHNDDPHRYILMVFWDKIEDHTEGFRLSDAYQHWKELLHPFYASMPVVEYYQPCILLKKNNPSLD